MMHDLLSGVNTANSAVPSKQTFVPFVPPMFHLKEHTQVLDFNYVSVLFYMFVPCSLNIYIPTTGRGTTLQCKLYNRDPFERVLHSVIQAEQRNRPPSNSLTS